MSSPSKKKSKSSPQRAPRENQINLGAQSGITGTKLKTNTEDWPKRPLVLSFFSREEEEEFQKNDLSKEREKRIFVPAKRGKPGFLEERGEKGNRDWALGR